MDIIRNTVETMFDEENKFDPRHFRLSESGYHPEWRLKKALGMIPQNREPFRGIFFAGLSYEHLVTKYLGRIFKQRIRYQDPAPHPDGEGHIDAVVGIDGAKVGIEVKTTSLKKMKDVPFTHNIMQVQAYLHFRPDLAEFVLIYIPREDPHPDLWRWFPVERDCVAGVNIQWTLMALINHRNENKSEWFPGEDADPHFDSYFIPPDDRQYMSGDRKACSSIEAHEKELAEYVDLKTSMKYLSAFEKGQREPRQRELEEIITPFFSSPVAGESRTGSRFLDFNGARITQVCQERVTHDVKAAEKCGVDIAMLTPFRKVSRSISYRVSKKGESENGYSEE